MIWATVRPQLIYSLTCGRIPQHACSEDTIHPQVKPAASNVTALSQQMAPWKWSWFCCKFYLQIGSGTVMTASKPCEDSWLCLLCRQESRNRLVVIPSWPTHLEAAMSGLLYGPPSPSLYILGNSFLANSERHEEKVPNICT